MVLGFMALGLDVSPFGLRSLVDALANRPKVEGSRRCNNCSHSDQTPAKPLRNTIPHKPCENSTNASRSQNQPSANP